MAGAGRASSPDGLAADAKKRESTAPTGIPGGIAIPHCRSSHVLAPSLGFARLAEPVDFGAADGQAADLIFMIAAPLIHQQSIEIDLPDSSAEVLDMPEDAGNDLMPLVLTVDAQGNYYLNRNDSSRVLQPEEIVDIVNQEMTAHPDLPVLVQGDATANYNQVIDGIVLLQQAGAPKVGLVTEQPPEETGTAEAKP